jgi:arylsulfatase A-like enzyme
VTADEILEQPAQGFPAFLRAGEIAADLTMENVLDDLAARAAAYIDAQADGDRPFFLYLPLTAPHKPVLPHSRFRNATELGSYGDFIVQVDATVGTVLDAIDDAGVTENTLVIFTSDNGSFMYRRDDAKERDHTDDETIQAYRAENHTSNGPFRGTKADIWEGGHHVPFFARWPGRIAAGAECAETICLTDFFATAADILDAELPADAAPDSFSLLSLMKGDGWQSPRAPVIHHSAGGMFAIRDGRWKLVLGNGSGGRQQPRGKPFEQPYALFDLSADIAEQHNVIEEHPDVARGLETRCLEIRDSGRSR